MSESLDDRAGRLLAAGLDVACRIRDDDPAEVRRLVDALPVDEVRDLVLLLAAGLPVDLPLTLLYGWHVHPRRPQRLCGTPTAAKRHQARGEPVDDACGWALREYDRVRTRARRAA